MKNKDDRQASFDFDRPSKLAIDSKGLVDMKPPENVIRVVFSNKSRIESAESILDVYAINKRILDLAK
ncbi:hypothetical protein [Burkholderia stagnalis]|uniref:hypothetical protein n=1 Tax=Burkholderia stagnalis TaxID=1503054 RepID=UPI0009BDF5D0|nr:hypothetical protein [Burkholderia stagnalis]